MSQSLRFLFGTFLCTNHFLTFFLVRWGYTRSILRFFAIFYVNRIYPERDYWTRSLKYLIWIQDSSKKLKLARILYVLWTFLGLEIYQYFPNILLFFLALIKLNLSWLTIKFIGTFLERILGKFFYKKVSMFFFA